MDIIICIAMLLMLGLAIFHLAVWSKQKWSIVSPHLRSAGFLMICFTVLTILMFGMRLFLKPEVQVTYHDSSQEIYSNLTVVKDDTRIVESKKVQTCDVVFEKSYPLFLYMGKDTRTNKYKMPCDTLTNDMKSDVSVLLSYLKEETRNAK